MKISFINIGRDKFAKSLTPEWIVRGFPSVRAFKLAAGECLQCQSPARSGKRYCEKHGADRSRRASAAYRINKVKNPEIVEKNRAASRACFARRWNSDPEFRREAIRKSCERRALRIKNDPEYHAKKKAAAAEYRRRKKAAA